MRSGIWWLGMLVVIAVFSAARAAWAQGMQPATDGAANGATDRAKALAQEHLDRGNQLRNAGAFDEALAEFRAAYGAFPSPKILFNQAEVESQLGRFVDAAAHYDTFLYEFSHAESEEDAQRIEAAKEGAQIAHAKVASNREMSLSPGTPVHLSSGPVTLGAEAPPPRKSILRRWSFWAAAGAVILGGVAAIYAVSRSRRPPCPAKAFCTEGD